MIIQVLLTSPLAMVGVALLRHGLLGDLVCPRGVPGAGSSHTCLWHFQVGSMGARDTVS